MPLAVYLYWLCNACPPGFTSDDGEEEDEECNSEFADSAEDEERSKLTAQSLLNMQVGWYAVY